ncbi:FAD-linked oxidase-like protein [Vararia minispora EC-137]|uniref:FAD-linked oxidase-like protein n=1 Tax=Vararia minispora EC-137 TaxID=1314806 RepID=A0ACB8QCX1_9AGAM|nr:FAD-linked oxidase-like protein [Vararia minispora EC-137]
MYSRCLKRFSPRVIRPLFVRPALGLRAVRAYSSGQSSDRSPGVWHYVLIGAIAGVTYGFIDKTLLAYFPSHDASIPSHAPVDPKPYASPEECTQAIDELRAALGAAKVLTNPTLLKMYGHSDNSYHPTSPHAVVVKPASTEDVVKIVNVARRWRMPITAYSGATSLEGHFSGFPTGSICVDMSGMNRILAIHEEDGDVVCQAGARWEDINAHLAEKGIPLFFPLDPGPGATIGGMVGTGCSGTNAVRYGTARAEWFLNLTVVLPSGEVITTKRRARKSATGFDTTKLFIGAEGTLGIVTEATLRLTPVVPTKVAMAQFPNPERAVSAVQEILLSPYGANVQCVEFLDDKMMDAINGSAMTSSPLPVSDSLFFKLQGSPEAIALTASTVSAITKAHGASRFAFAATDQEADELWQNRKYALMATVASKPGYRPWTTDVCVPPSKLPQLVHETKKDLADAGIPATIVGHVGDGNFHAIMLFRDDTELPNIDAASHRLVERALALDGTCTGEHGIGIGKKKYLIDELGVETVALMWTVKRSVDPLNIMNPGKLYPDLPKERK